MESSGDSSSDGFPVGAGASASPALAPTPQRDGATARSVIGKKVSHYRVLEVVGGGGMKVVYKAEDLKLGRRMAMKFLPEELGNDPKAQPRDRRCREKRPTRSTSLMNIAVADEGGNLVAHVRMDGAWIGSIDISPKKAYTARAFDFTTKDLAQHTQSGGQFFGIHASNNGKIMIVAGGIPLKRDGRVGGAIGVSGGSGRAGPRDRRPNLLDCGSLCATVFLISWWRRGEFGLATNTVQGAEFGVFRNHVHDQAQSASRYIVEREFRVWWSQSSRSMGDNLTQGARARHSGLHRVSACRMAPTTSITVLVHQYANGDKAALNSLLPLVYAQLRRIAQKHLRGERAGHTLQPTALVHEMYARFAGQEPPDLSDRVHFLSVAAHVMRQILIDHARTKYAQKRGGRQEKLSLDEAREACIEKPAIMVRVDDALNHLASHDPRKAQLIEMRFFGGLTAEESAAFLDLPVHVVRRDLRVAQAWLQRELNHDSGETSAGAQTDR